MRLCALVDWWCFLFAFIFRCKMMIVAPWKLECCSTHTTPGGAWLKTFKHASCSLRLPFGCAVHRFGLFHACSFIFDIFIRIFVSVFPCRYSFDGFCWLRSLTRWYLRSNRNTTYHCVSCQNRKIMFSTMYSTNSWFFWLVVFFSFSLSLCINKREWITILWCSDDEALRFERSSLSALAHSAAPLSHFYRYWINIVFVFVRLEEIFASEIVF